MTDTIAASSVVSRFEACAGKTLEQWLKDNASKHTMADAARIIGYGESSGLHHWCRRKGLGVKFKRSPHHPVPLRCAQTQQ